MNTKYTIGALALGVLIVVGLIFANGSGAMVSAVGESTIKAQPDKVSVYLTAEGRGKTAGEAKDAHDKIVDDLTISLLKMGFSKDEIKTQSYNIYPEYDWSAGTQKEKGFVASEQIIVETSDFGKTSDIVDAGIDSGALVSYINFELSTEKQSEYKTQALEEAGKDAKKKAEATASGLGKSLGGLVSVETQDYNYGPYVYYDKAVASSTGSGVAEARSAALNLAPQDIEVRATIRVEYKLRSF